MTCCIISDVVAVLCDSCFVHENGKISSSNPQKFLPITHSHAVAILLCNILCAINSVVTRELVLRLSW
jgi:hypothetical protein